MDKNLKIDSIKCIKCRACINDCVANALTMGEKGPVWSKNGESNCIKCQHCLAICPTGAISILGRRPEASANLKNPASFDALASLLRNRRSIRNYQQKNVDKAVLTEIMTAVDYSPTGVNFHRLHFSIIASMEKMADFRTKLTEKVLYAIDHDQLPEFLSDFKNFRQPLLEQVDLFCRTAPHLIAVAAPSQAPCRDVDPFIALSQFELCCVAKGIGTVWCGWIYLILKYVAPELLAELKIPEGFELSYVMLFGYPKIAYQRSTQPEKFSTVIL